MKQYRMMALSALAGLALAGSSAVAQITNAPVGTMAKPDQNFMNEAADQIFHRPGPP
jgi:hypothetical protein